MKYKITLTTVTLLLTMFSVFSQYSGNGIIGQNNGNSQFAPQQTANKLYLSDTAFTIQGNVLLNIIADNYVATFGVAESSATLTDANTKIDKRIKDFIAALTKMGVAQQDIYVDMTTQTQLSDYKVKGDYAEQYITGYEQKKNVIVKFTDIKALDKMILTACEFGIYDLAKVDYLVTDIDKVYSQLFQAAMDVINVKKELYIKATNVKLKSSSEMYGESFYSLYPPQLYKNYTPDVSTEFYEYNSYAKRKDLKKNTTYYYDKTSYSGFDKVINPVVTEPAVEFIMTLQIKFKIDF